MPVRRPRSFHVCFAALAACIAVHTAHVIGGVGFGGADGFVERWLYTVIEALATALLWARVATDRRDRPAWALFATYGDAVERRRPRLDAGLRLRRRPAVPELDRRRVHRVLPVRLRRHDPAAARPPRPRLVAVARRPRLRLAARRPAPRSCSASSPAPRARAGRRGATSPTRSATSLLLCVVVIAFGSAAAAGRTLGAPRLALALSAGGDTSYSYSGRSTYRDSRCSTRPGRRRSCSSSRPGCRRRRAARRSAPRAPFAAPALFPPRRVGILVLVADPRRPDGSRRWLAAGALLARSSCALADVPREPRACCAGRATRR